MNRVARIERVEGATIHRLVDNDVQAVVVNRRTDREAVNVVVDREHRVISRFVLQESHSQMIVPGLYVSRTAAQKIDAG